MKDDAYNEFIERVRSETDIVEVISEYVVLKRNGRNYWGCCPFHNEKTPSFSVAPEKGFFYCFGCHAGGNAINFVMKYENLSFSEAVKKLAEKANIPLPKQDKSPQEIAREREIVRMWNVQDTARNFFNACLTKTHYGEMGKRYLLQRGLTEQDIEKFKLGFAPDAWDKLSAAFVKRDFSEELLVKAGLAVERNSGGIYDRFRNRVMFPISNERGQVVGFGGRVMDDSQPKYLNSPETVVFNKRNVLFALDLAFKEIKRAGYVIIVEGYMDAVTAHCNGIGNVVASLGTAFTEMQCRKLLRYAKQLVFAYDSDAAGQNATIRALSIAKRIGAQVKVLSIPDGKDPDEFIRKHGKDAFLELADKALPLVEYRVTRSLEQNDYTTLEGKVTAVAEMIPVLGEIENAVEVNAYIGRIAQRVGIDENAIRSELHKWISKNKKDNYVRTGQNTFVQPLDNAVVQAGRYLIRFIWQDKSVLPYLMAGLSLEEFQSSEHREIISCLDAKMKNDMTLSETQVTAELSEKAVAEWSRCFMLELENNSIELIDDYIKTIHLDYLQRRYEQHRLRADELQRRGEDGYIQELAESMKVNNEIKKLQ